MKNYNFKMIVFGVFTLSIISISAQNINRIENKILKSIETNNLEAIEFLKKVVNINSGTMNHQGVKLVGDDFNGAFQKIGFETSWYDMSEVNRSGHLFAENKGQKGKKILLIGHLDTVFELDSPIQEFKMLNDSIAHAPGGNDMKGGDVIILYALKALADNGLLKNAQIIVAFTGDEESSGNPLSVSRKHLIEAAKRSEIALCFETSTGFNYATVARRGSSSWKLEVEGKAAHSSGIFNDRTGAGAIFEVARILNEFYSTLKGEEYLTFNPGIILGGTNMDFNEALSKGTAFGKSNVVAQKTIVEGDIRFISEDQKERVREKMREIVANNLPQTSAKITFEDSYPAMSPTIGNDNLLKQLSQVSMDLNLGKVEAYDPGKRGAADTSFVAEYVDCLDGLGAMGSGAHTINETVNLNTFESLTKRAAILIYRLINQ